MFGLRIAEAFATIQQYQFLGAEGQSYVVRLKAAMERLPAAMIRDIDNRLSLGENVNASRGFPGFSSPITRRLSHDRSKDERREVRACMLAHIVMKRGGASVDSASIIAKIRNLDSAHRIQYFRSCFPLVSDYGAGHSWDSNFFTDPSRHDPQNFRYIVHAIRVEQAMNPASTAPVTNYTAILANPNAVVRGWTAISCSVIDQSHSETYHNCGLILRVPPENLLMTSDHDVAFANHAGANMPPGASRETQMLIAGRFVEEIRSRNSQHRVSSPEHILARTGTTGRYNEIIVNGTTLPGGAPRPASQGRIPRRHITVIGFFVQAREVNAVQRATMLSAAHNHDLPFVSLR